MNCPHCGTHLDDGARFCGACGARLQANPAPVQAEFATTQVDPPGSPSGAVTIKNKSMPPTPLSNVHGQGGQAVAPRFITPVPVTPPPNTPLPAPVAPGGPPLANTRGDPFVGRTLNNRYVIDSKIGEGGFGAVYRGRQVQVGREVALKVLHPEMARDPNVLARFRREGSVACNLRDAHTITTYDFDQTPEGVLYIAMELLKGRSLHDIFHSEAPLPWQRVFHVIEQICSSLAEAHAQGIVHRDLKPENIYLENRPGKPDFAKVLDFGIAKIVSGDIGQGQQSLQLTATGQTLGTLEYMSPEQLMGKQLDGRSDIYAIGVVGYELLTGRLPFPDAQGPAALIAAQLRRTPEPPSRVRGDGVPPGVDWVILKMLEKDRAKRFADANDLRQMVLAVIGSGGAVPGHNSGAQGQMPPPAHISGPHLHQQPHAPSGPQAAPAAPYVPSEAAASGKERGPAGAPSTEQVEASAGSKLWIWVVLAGILVGGAIGAYIALWR